MPPSKPPPCKLVFGKRTQKVESEVVFNGKRHGWLGLVTNLKFLNMYTSFLLAASAPMLLMDFLTLQPDKEEANKPDLDSKR